MSKPIVEIYVSQGDKVSAEAVAHYQKELGDKAQINTFDIDKDESALRKMLSLSRVTMPVVRFGAKVYGPNDALSIRALVEAKTFVEKESVVEQNVAETPVNAQ